MAFQKRSLFLFGLLIIQATPTLQDTRYSDDAGSCQIIGDPDLYGVGIRASLYLSHAGAIIALAFGLQKQVKDSRIAMSIVVIAITINTIISASKGSFVLLEWYLIWILGTMLPTIVLSPASWIGGDSLATAILGLGICIMALCFPWIYFIIPEQGHKVGCEAKIYVLYMTLDIYNKHWQIFIKVIACFAFACAVVLTPVWIWFIGRAVSITLSGKEKKKPERPNYQEENTIFEMDVKAAIIGVIWLFYGISCAVFVEMTLIVGGIDMSGTSLSSASQQIPFLIGLFSFVTVCWAALKRAMQIRRKRQEALKKRKAHRDKAVLASAEEVAAFRTRELEAPGPAHVAPTEQDIADAETDIELVPVQQGVKATSFQSEDWDLEAGRADHDVQSSLGSNNPYRKDVKGPVDD